MLKIVAILAFAGLCLADDPYSRAPAYKPSSYKEPAYDDAAKYNFDWRVKDDYTYNNFGQYEKRDGYTTDGSYSVLLPDGRLQTVTYYVNGDSGFVAEVTYSGEPKYDNYKAAPSYKAETYAPAPAYKADPYNKPAPAYKAEPYNKPAYKSGPAYAPAPAYKAQPAYKPAYKPAPAYAPAPYKADTYKPAPAYTPAAY